MTRSELDQAQHLLGVVRRYAHELAVEQRSRQQHPHAHRMVDRHDPERGLAEDIAVVRDLRDSRGELIAVRPRHALGPPGGARCVEHEAGAVLTDGGQLGQRLALRQSGIGHLACLAPSRCDEDARQAFATTLRQRLADGVRRGLLECDRLRFRILEAENHLCGARPPVKGREHDPERLARPIEGGRLIAVLEQDQQPVAGSEAQPRQTAGHARQLRVPLCISARHAAVDDGAGLGTASDGKRERGGEIHARLFPGFPDRACGAEDRRHDWVVAGAAADVARQHVAHFRFRWVRVAAEEVGGRHQDAGGAEAALQGVMPPEGLLEDAKLALSGETFDCAHRSAVALDRELRAAAYGPSVDQHGAGAAHAVLAADVRAVQAQLVTQEIREQPARLRLTAPGLAVHFERHDMTRIGFQSPHVKSSAWPRRPRRSPARRGCGRARDGKSHSP